MPKIQHLWEGPDAEEDSVDEQVSEVRSCKESQTPNSLAMEPVCLNPGCGKTTWSGEPNDYCSTKCKQDVAAQEAMLAVESPPQNTTTVIPVSDRNTFCDAVVVEGAPAFNEVVEISEKARYCDVLFMNPSRVTGCHSGSHAASSFGSRRVSLLPSAFCHEAMPSIMVTVLAYHSSGRNETIFETVMSKPLNRLITVWCELHKLDEKRASFTFQGNEVDPAHTIGSLGYDPGAGPFILKAAPKRSAASKDQPKVNVRNA